MMCLCRHPLLRTRNSPAQRFDPKLEPMAFHRRHRRVFARFRSAGSRPWASKVGMLLLAGSVVALGIILVLRPFALAYTAGITAKQRTYQRANHYHAALGEHFSSRLAPPFDPTSASAEGVSRWLNQEPHVVAIMQRPHGHLWVKQGHALVASNQKTPYSELVRIAERSLRENEISAWDAKGGLGCSVSAGWITFWEWRAGSPALLALLKQAGLGPDSDFIAAFQTGDAGALPRPWVEGPPPEALKEAKIKSIDGASFFPDAWALWIVAKERPGLEPARAYHRALLLGWIQSLSIAGAVGIGFWFRRRHKRRDALDADRLANMTHSLKTPLAVLKLRCDTLRLGRASEEEARHELSQMGMEVDRLSTLIDQALRRFRGQMAEHDREAVHPEWFLRFTEELQPAFQAEQRHLRVDLADITAWANLSSLRSALLTLLENALNHGAGDVSLTTKVQGHHLLIHVTDEGQGMDRAALRRLGRPFQRMRRPHQEGFEREGLGLGLHLLIQSALEEGWGLEMVSGPGMVVTLRLPVLEGA